jgi:hypothetical protein
VAVERCPEVKHNRQRSWPVRDCQPVMLQAGRIDLAVDQHSVDRRTVLENTKYEYPTSLEIWLP